MVDNKSRLKHRVVMEEYLQRELEKGEHVHHCDGNKLNCSIENLELVSASEHGRCHMTSEVAKQRSILGHKARWNYVSGV
jgi:hypothetical protein